MRATDLVRFIAARHNIWELRNQGHPSPWTQDPILRNYRFCNVYRNLDTQTRLIHDNWLTPHNWDPDVWFAMVLARLVNWWPTLQAMGYPVPWHANVRKRVWAGYCERLNAKQKVFTGAYMVRADAVISGSKMDYLMQYVLTPLWAARLTVRPRTGDTLADFHARLMQHRDMGSFMAAQVVADVKYAEGGPLYKARDFLTWAASGPGSRRGLNRVLGRDVNAPWREGDWADQFDVLRRAVTIQLRAEYPHMPTVSGQDLQNCLCEFDKYERVRLGQGRPRSLFKPST